MACTIPCTSSKPTASQSKKRLISSEPKTRVLLISIYGCRGFNQRRQLAYQVRLQKKDVEDIGAPPARETSSTEAAGLSRKSRGDGKSVEDARLLYNTNYCVVNHRPYTYVIDDRPVNDATSNDPNGESDQESTFIAELLPEKSVKDLSDAFEADCSRAQVPFIENSRITELGQNLGFPVKEFMGEQFSSQKVKEESSLAINQMIHWQDSHTFVVKNQSLHKSWIVNNHAL